MGYKTALASGKLNSFHSQNYFFLFWTLLVVVAIWFGFFETVSHQVAQDDLTLVASLLLQLLKC